MAMIESKRIPPAAPTESKEAVLPEFLKKRRIVTAENKGRSRSAVQGKSTRLIPQQVQVLGKNALPILVDCYEKS